MRFPLHGFFPYHIQTPRFAAHITHYWKFTLTGTWHRAGIDLEDPATIRKAVDYVGRLVDEVEKSF